MSIVKPDTHLMSVGRACLLALALPAMARAAMPPAGVTEALARGQAQELIVEFESRAIDQEAADLRRRLGFGHDKAEVLRLREDRYRRIKAGVTAGMPSAEHAVVADYAVLPLAVLHVRTPRALAALAGHRDVVGIYRDTIKFPVPHLVPQLDNQSRSLVGTPAASAAGLTGAGTTVLVIDTGANYTVSDLGSCTAVASPGACRLSHALYVNAANAVVSDPNPATSASNGHGTNVAAIVAGVASATHIAVINVFGTSGTTSDAKILAAINWGIANQAAFNIRAINLSLGDGQLNTSPCGSGNPYVAAFSNARSAGIVPVASSGNEGYLNGIAGPACAPGGVSVGAVYAANYGGLAWTNCTDQATAPDQIACFSNSASFLTLLAPGAIITAGGYSYGGTSQAAPFVAATVALANAAYPSDTPAQLVSRITSAGKVLTDPRNAQATPRLDLASLAPPPSDVPSLPEWAALLLAGALLLSASRFAPTPAGKWPPVRRQP